MPPWATAGIAAALGLAAYAVASAGSFAITQRTDPTLKDLLQNRYIISGLIAAGGLFLAYKKHPILGAGVAGGALASMLGSKLTLALGEIVDVKPATPAKMSAVYNSDMGLVYGQDMAGYQMGDGYESVGGYLPEAGGVGAVYSQNMQGFTPAAPWSSGNPF